MILKKYGYIILYRDFMNWEWYSDGNTFRLFIHCLMCANHTKKKWQGNIIQEGSFVTSIPILADNLKLSVQKIKTALKHLKTSGYLTCKTTHRYTVISIKDYDMYQITNRQVTCKQLTDNLLITTTNKEKKEKKEKKEYRNRNEIFKKLKEKYERDGHL